MHFYFMYHIITLVNILFRIFTLFRKTVKSTLFFSIFWKSVYEIGVITSFNVFQNSPKKPFWSGIPYIMETLKTKHFISLVGIWHPAYSLLLCQFWSHFFPSVLPAFYQIDSSLLRSKLLILFSLLHFILYLFYFYVYKYNFDVLLFCYILISLDYFVVCSILFQFVLRQNFESSIYSILFPNMYK